MKLFDCSLFIAFCKNLLHAKKICSASITRGTRLSLEYDLLATVAGSENLVLIVFTTVTI